MVRKSEFILKSPEIHPTAAKFILRGQIAREDLDEGIARACFEKAMGVIADELLRPAISEKDTKTYTDLLRVLQDAVAGRQPLIFVLRES